MVAVAVPSWARKAVAHLIPVALAPVQVVVVPVRVVVAPILVVDFLRIYNCIPAEAELRAYLRGVVPTRWARTRSLLLYVLVQQEMTTRVLRRRSWAEVVTTGKTTPWTFVWGASATEPTAVVVAVADVFRLVVHY